MCADGEAEGPFPMLGSYTMLGIQNAWGPVGFRQGGELDEWTEVGNELVIAAQEIGFDENGSLLILEEGLPFRSVDIRFWTAQWEGGSVDAAATLGECACAEIGYGDFQAMLQDHLGSVFLQVRPNGASSWFSEVELQIATPGPAIEGIRPSKGPIDTVVAVTITGRYFTGDGLWTEYDGLVISNVNFISDTTITAFFEIGSANPGDATVTVTTEDGSAETTFHIVVPALIKEYIYLNGRVLAIDKQ
jgi:hypothetical protein